ncbi:MAG: hypothetical protein HC905_32305 [Bacteroidales bacterium]|nr:hypothetical protein [Bacteroidales bacterium]
MLFASLGYNSIEELNGVYGTLGEVDGKPVEYKMPWNAVKKEIDEDRPFIVIMATPQPVLGATTTATGRPAKPSTSHLVIVNGYAPATGI